jgi:hypothetical protein
MRRRSPFKKTAAAEVCAIESFFVVVVVALYFRTNSSTEIGGQGDQIGRIFAYWAIDYLGQFFRKLRCSSNLVLPFTTVRFMY